MLPHGTWRRVVWQVCTDVSDITTNMEALRSTDTQTPIKLHGVTSQQSSQRRQKLASAKISSNKSRYKKQDAAPPHVNVPRTFFHNRIVT